MRYSRAMESLQDILTRYEPPGDPELVAVKRYVEEQFHAQVSVAVRGDVLVITVPSAALANTLRLQSTKMQAVCQVTKRLVFRIG